MPTYWYFVGNRKNGQSCDVLAGTREEACRSRGWMVEDCVVICVGELQTPAAHRSAAVREPAPPAERLVH